MILNYSYWTAKRCEGTSVTVKEGADKTRFQNGEET